MVSLKTYVKPATQPAFTRFNVFLRDKFSCQFCGSREDLTFDHLLPRSRGGHTTWVNVVAACSPCNLKKGNRLPHEVGMRLAREPVHPKFLFSTHMLRHPHASSLLDSWRKYLVAVPTPS